MRIEGKNDLFSHPSPKRRKAIQAWSLRRAISMRRAHCKLSLSTTYIAPSRFPLWTPLNGELWNFRTKGTKLLSWYVSFTHSSNMNSIPCVIRMVFPFSVNWVVPCNESMSYIPAHQRQISWGQRSASWILMKQVSKAKPSPKRDTSKFQMLPFHVERNPWISEHKAEVERNHAMDIKEVSASQEGEVESLWWKE